MLPEDKRKAYSIISKSSSYFLKESKLYRIMPMRLSFLYVTNEASQNLIKKVQEMSVNPTLVVGNYPKESYIKGITG